MTSPTATSITSTSATLGGTVSSDAGASLSKRGVLYALTSVNSNPTLGGTGVKEADDASTSTGTFTEAITGLTAGAGYSYVAFATQYRRHQLYQPGFDVRHIVSKHSQDRRGVDRDGITKPGYFCHPTVVRLVNRRRPDLLCRSLDEGRGWIEQWDHLR